MRDAPGKNGQTSKHSETRTLKSKNDHPNGRFWSGTLGTIRTESRQPVAGDL